MAFQLENPELTNQIVIKQLDNESQPTKTTPILFGYTLTRKWQNTIFGIDKESFEIKRFESSQIDLYACDLVQVVDSLYALKRNESFIRYRIGKLDGSIN